MIGSAGLHSGCYWPIMHTSTPEMLLMHELIYLFGLLM
jgi:hypothetical protein